MSKHFGADMGKWLIARAKGGRCRGQWFVCPPIGAYSDYPSRAFASGAEALAAFAKGGKA